MKQDTVGTNEQVLFLRCSGTLSRYSKIENTVRYLGVDIDDALVLAGRIETRQIGKLPAPSREPLNERPISVSSNSRSNIRDQGDYSWLDSEDRLDVLSDHHSSKELKLKIRLRVVCHIASL